MCQGKGIKAGHHIPRGHCSGCHSGILTPTSRRLHNAGGGPEITGRRREERQMGEKKNRKEQEEDGGTQRSQAEEETQDVETRETGPENGRRGKPTRRPPQED
ncbi:hypothetical protein NDU88_004286 [Pleurodeles waltl]|uniref:Uncharacterized protein n=1 Tax=Pleurodeles waltl TaxID=8319 RepID=A0AAV7WV77_PLEWA|nr:hypothetical protein NDU88_004286 [Pleurodeles waltl]